MKLQVIQLEPYDDVISVRDRLSFVDSERVLLVWPRMGAILRRKLDLVLILREAARHGTRLALVTADPDVRDHAQELNISTFDSVDASHHSGWKKPLNKVFVDRSDRPDNAPDPYELRLAASRLNQLTPTQRQMRRATRLVSAVVLAAALFAVVYVVLPGADITLVPAQSQINATVKLVADPTISQVNVESGHIPATLVVIEVQTQASIPTTGSSDVPSSLASGTVTFTNQTGTPVFVPAGTVVTSVGAKPARYRVTSDVTVDAGVNQTASATIEALPDSAGPLGNVEPNLIVNIEGPLNTSLSVHNQEATRGGTIRQQGVVAKADYDNLLVLAREKLRQVSVAEFGSRLTGTQFLAPDSIKLVEERPEWTSYSAFVGDQADNLTLTLRARVQGLVIDEQLARQASLASLAAKIPSGQHVAPESVAFTRGAIQGSDAKGLVTFLMSASANIGISIDTDRVRQRVAGVSTNDAVELLQRDWLLDPRRPPQIAVYPGILGRLPMLPVRINVRILS